MTFRRGDTLVLDFKEGNQSYGCTLNKFKLNKSNGQTNLTHVKTVAYSSDSYNEELLSLLSIVNEAPVPANVLNLETYMRSLKGMCFYPVPTPPSAGEILFSLNGFGTQ